MKSYTEYPVIALIAGALVIELNLNLIIVEEREGIVSSHILSTFYRCPQYAYVTISQYQIIRLPVIYQLHIA